MLTLRKYQSEAVNAVIEHAQISTEPQLVILPTGAGKSLVVGALAKIYGTALVVQPSKELVSQNAEKCAALEVEYTLYCAGLGEKDFGGPVVLGTGASLRKDLDCLPHVAVLIVDEAHRNIDEMLLLYVALKDKNPDLICVGLTATGYALGRGYIYRTRPNNSVWPKEQAKNPPYGKCVYERHAGELVDMGYLSPVVVGATRTQYDGSGLVVERGKFTAASVSSMVGKLKTTDLIVRDIKDKMRGRNRCMIFTSSVDHAETVRELFGREARMVTGQTPAHQRALYISMYKRGRIRYLINVATLTTGFDDPATDTIAVMRPTDSASLFEQIKGRGMRLYLGKTECLLLDYAGNIERFYPDGDIYVPQIQACSDKPEGSQLAVTCPVCRHVNDFKAMPNEEGLMISGDGHFMTLDGHPVRDENGQTIPAHYGRRCRGTDDAGVQCAHRWVGKRCMVCQRDNDIAARKCSCGARLVDWNKSLTKAASQINVVQLRRGWTGERVEYLKFVETPSWIRADLYVKSRKSPLSVFIKSQEARIHMRQNVPYAVAWKRAAPGDQFPAVKVFFTQDEWEKNR